MTIDDKTRELLLKARKKADAGFNNSNWSTVVRALGFQYEVAHKVRQEVLKVRITAPNGAVLDVEKDPRNRTIGFGHVGLPKKGHGKKAVNDVVGCICGADHWPCCRLTYTSLTRWAAEQGYPLDTLAARALGMLTVAEEDEEDEYKARDWTHTGTCGVCNQNIKMEGMGKGTALVLHGYRRPGDGQVYGECFGRGYEPYELSPKAVLDYVVRLKKIEASQVEELVSLTSGAEVRLSKQVRQADWSTKTVWVRVGEPEFVDMLKSVIHAVETKLRITRSDIAHYTKKGAEWKLDELPEFKLARRFGGVR